MSPREKRKQFVIGQVGDFTFQGAKILFQTKQSPMNTDPEIALKRSNSRLVRPERYVYVKPLLFICWL
jgi:hypothetical protein